MKRAWGLVVVFAFLAGGALLPLARAGDEPPDCLPAGEWRHTSGAVIRLELVSPGVPNGTPEVWVDPTPEVVTTPTAPPTNTPKPTLAATATLDAALPTVEADKCFGVVKEGPLRVREQPWGAVLGALDAGDTVALEAYTLDDTGGRWYRVYWYPGVPGYVWAGLVQVAPAAGCSGLARE